MDRAFATNVHREQNVKTCGKISSTCHNNRYDSEMRRTRDVFTYVPETHQKLGMLLLGGMGDAANTPNLPDELTIPPLSSWMLDFNDITRRPTNILQEKEKARDRKQWYTVTRT
jgi:hypothetical protein